MWVHVDMSEHSEFSGISEPIETSEPWKHLLKLGNLRMHDLMTKQPICHLVI